MQSVSTADPLEARIARAQEAARERAASLRACVPALAAHLFARGARRVVLFGSLASGATAHAETDVDLCVEGLAEESLGDAALELVERAGADVDLVRWEDASPRLRARVAADGIEVPRVSG